MVARTKLISDRTFNLKGKKENRTKNKIEEKC